MSKKLFRRKLETNFSSKDTLCNIKSFDSINFSDYSHVIAAIYFKVCEYIVLDNLYYTLKINNANNDKFNITLVLMLFIN
jgi:hypothetical protein